MTGSELDELRREYLPTHPVVLALSPETRRFYLSVYSPTQQPRKWHDVVKLRKWATARGIAEAKLFEIADELFDLGLACYDPVFDDVAFFYPGE